MNFCDPHDPHGDVGRVRHVLGFLEYVTGLPMPEAQPCMDEQEWSGLAWIIRACRDTLERVEDSDRR